MRKMAKKKENHLTLMFYSEPCYRQSPFKGLAAFFPVFMYLFLFLQMPLNFLLEVKSLSLPREISNSLTVAYAQAVPWTHKKHSPGPPRLSWICALGRHCVMRAALCGTHAGT